MRFDPTTTRTLIATINPDAPTPEAKAPHASATPRCSCLTP